MADIFHSLRMRASTDEVLRAVTEDDLLRPWWASDGKLAVRSVAEGNRLAVTWRCVDGPPEWIGTDITFALARDGAETIVRFAHRNWRETSDAFAQCTTKWGRVLLALKSRVETPEADDLRA
ncbi:SRPBCC domain-containing protein [soil metagenome]|jgi:uncharacterized protein YndB with AHSA1/START domain|nr:SRPBCC domain-containing protein [Labilithrix sp.]